MMLSTVDVVGNRARQVLGVQIFEFPELFMRLDLLPREKGRTWTCWQDQQGARLEQALSSSILWRMYCMIFLISAQRAKRTKTNRMTHSCAQAGIFSLQ